MVTPGTVPKPDLPGPPLVDEEEEEVIGVDEAEAGDMVESFCDSGPVEDDVTEIKMPPGGPRYHSFEAADAHLQEAVDGTSFRMEEISKRVATPPDHTPTGDANSSK